MRILITGGSGYLGGRIASGSFDSCHIVRLGSRNPVPGPNCAAEIETSAMDVLDVDGVMDALKSVKSVIHLASMNARDCDADPVKALRVNTMGVLNTLMAAIASGVERFIYVSTVHVYGSTLSGEISEKTLPNPVHPYTISHRAAEDYVLAAHRTRRICGLVIRLANGFGAPRRIGADCWMLLVNDLCRQAVRNRKLVLHSSGLQQRNFVTISDVERAIRHLLVLPERECSDGLFNLGGEASISIWQMVQQIAGRCEAVLGFRPEIIRPEPNPGESHQSFSYNIEKLKKTGFYLLERFDDEIDKTLLFCKKVFE